MSISLFSRQYSALLNKLLSSWLCYFELSHKQVFFVVAQKLNLQLQVFPQVLDNAAVFCAQQFPGLFFEPLGVV
jgi:cell shape-determining protein MreC